MPAPIDPPVSGTLELSNTPEGMPPIAGRGRLWLFPITRSRFENGSGPSLVIDLLAKTLKDQGYRVIPETDAEDHPVLECYIDKFHFTNIDPLVPLFWFGYFPLPIFMTTGEIELVLVLRGADGDVLWNGYFSDTEYGFPYAFSDTVNDSMEEILEAVAQEIRSDEFRTACCAAAP